MRCCLAVLGLALAWAVEAAPQQGADFALKATDGRNHRLSEYRGEVVALVFWASWCSGCREQLEVLRDLESLYGPWGLRVLSISLDAGMEAPGRVAALLDLGFPVLMDSDRAVSRSWDPGRLPTTYLLDRSGTLRHVEVAGDAMRDAGGLVARVRALLEE